MKCKNCGNKIKQKDRKFCPECGTDVSEQIQAQGKKRKKTILLTGIPVLLIVGLVIAFFIYGKKTFDPQNIIDDFTEAVEEDDVDTLTTMLSSNNDDLTIDEESAGILLDYLSDQDEKMDEIVKNLEEHVESLQENEDIANDNYATIHMKKDGSKWLFFDDYKLNVIPAYIDITTFNDETDLYINDEKVDTTPEQDEEYDERFGPFVPGTYTVKGELETPYVSTDQTEELDLYNMEEDAVQQEITLDISNLNVNSSFEEEATLYINDQETDITIDKGTQSIGNFPLDDPIDMQLKKEMPWGPIESDLQTYHKNDSRIRFNHFTTITDDVETKIIDVINGVFTTHNEAINEGDASLLEDNVTEEFKDDLKDEIEEVEDDNPDYEGELIETQYSADWYQDPEYDDDREAYMFVFDVMLVYHEPNGDLGWTFKDDDENRYERATEVTMLFDEDDDEWKVDEKEGSHFFVYDGKDPKYEHDDDEWQEADVNEEIDEDDKDDDEDEEDEKDESKDDDENEDDDDNNNNNEND